MSKEINNLNNGLNNIYATKSELEELKAVSGDINELRDELTLKNTMSEGIDILNIITRKL